MDLSPIKEQVLSVFIECDVKSFPIDCFSITEHYGYKIIQYSCLSERKKQACLKLSEDACTIENNVYYNDQRSFPRIRFSVMHELGHIILNDDQEQVVNTFASHILAPRMAIHYAKCRNHVDVARIFGLSLEAADYAFNDYRRWHRMAVYKMSVIDKEIYNHFYNSEIKAFIYHVGMCAWCRTPLYNQPSKYECPLCSIPRYSYSYNPFDDPMSPESRTLGSMLAGNCD